MWASCVFNAGSASLLGQPGSNPAGGKKYSTCLLQPEAVLRVELSTNYVKVMLDCEITPGMITVNYSIFSFSVT